MKLLIIILLSLVVVSESIYIYNEKPWVISIGNTLHITSLPKPTPLLAYSFPNLHKTLFPASNITLGPIVNETTTSRSQIFYYLVPLKPNSTIFQKVSGIINMPTTPGNYPLIVMFRGFVPQDTYQPGIGTEPVAKEFAANKFITLAPDFLGYGQSDSPSHDPFENRFQTYVTALSLLSSLKNLNTGLSTKYSGTVSADMNKIGIWAHSNGGHIALSTLAISGVTYPTVLWAPVSTSFPYDILYYTNESDDQGKALRKELAQFEETYATDQFSPDRYYSWIKAPIAVDQGTSDHEVPMWWSENLVATLKKNNIVITYTPYGGADHNLLPYGWSSAVANDITFYTKQFGK